MKNLFAFLKRSGLISLFGLLAVAVLIWFLLEPVAGPRVRLLAILALVALWVLNRVRMYLVAKRTNNRLLDDLAGPPQEIPPSPAAHRIC